MQMLALNMMNGTPNFRSKLRKMEFPVPWRKHRAKTDSRHIFPRLRTQTHVLCFSNEEIEAEIMFSAVGIGVSFSSSRQLPMQKVLGPQNGKE